MFPTSSNPLCVIVIIAAVFSLLRSIHTDSFRTTLPYFGHLSFEMFEDSRYIGYLFLNKIVYTLYDKNFNFLDYC